MRNILLSTTAVTGLVLAFALAPTAAEAGTSHQIVLSIPAATSSGVDWTSSPLSFAAFDSTAGTLQSVLVFQQLSVDFGGSVSLGSSASSSFSGTLSAQTDLAITGGPSVLDGAPALTAIGSQGVALAPGDTTAFSSPGAFNSTGPSLYSSGLGDWESIGPSTLMIVLNSVTQPTSAYPGVLFDPDPNMNFELQITYNYSTSGSDVPEPASALLLGGGLLTLGTVRRRRISKNQPPE